MITILRKTYVFIIFNMSSAITLLAQQDPNQKDVNVNVNVRGGPWYTTWWIWVIVALLFIITIVAISTRSRRA